MSTSTTIRTAHFVAPTAGTFPQPLAITVPSGPGVAPKGVIFIAAQANTSNSVIPNARSTIGFCGEEFTQRSVSFYGENNDAAATAATYFRNDISHSMQAFTSSGAGLDGEADITEYITDGCTSSWTASTSIMGIATFFFGDEVETAVRSLNGSASIGGTASITGLPFAPDVVYVASVNQTFSTDNFGDEAMLSYGFAARTSATQSCTVLCSEYQQDPTSSGCLTRGDRCAIKLTSAAGTVTEGASLELTSWNSDGVTFTTRGEAASLSIMVFCAKLPGTVAWAGAPTFATSAVGSFSRTDPQFRPQALFLSGAIVATAGTISSTRGSMCLSAMDGTTNGYISWLFRDDQTTSDGRSMVSTVNDFNLIITSTTFDWTGALSSFDPYGFTFSVSDASAADRPTAYMAISVVNAIVANETMAISDGAQPIEGRLIVANETEEISDQNVTMVVGGSSLVLVVNETMEIGEVLKMLGTGTLVANETMSISDTSKLDSGVILVSNDTETISDSCVFSSRRLRRGARGEIAMGGAEEGAIFSAGSERGSTRA